MADIRRTSMIDDFNRADEDPLSGGGIWGKSFTDYYAMTNLDDRATRPYYNPSVRAYSHWTAQGFDGDCEIWAQRVNLAPIVGHSDRLFMAAGLGGGAIASSTWDGYLVLFYRLTSGPSCYLYRADNGTFTLLDSLVASVTNSAWAYLGRRGNEIEVWVTQADFNNWTLVCNATDATYTTDIWLGIGEGSQYGRDLSQDGWDDVGAGAPSTRRPQIYRWIKN